MKNSTKQSLAIALSAACVASVAPLAKVDASELFATQEISIYEIVGSLGKKNEGSCGEGQCGTDHDKGSEGRCGEGRCG